MRKNTKLGILGVCIIIAVSVAATYIFRKSVEETSEEEWRWIVDAVGRNVTIKKNVTRIVTLPVPSAATVTAIDGGGNSLVGMHELSMKAIKEGILGEMYPELLNVSVVLGGYHEPNIEQLVQLEPDVVIQWTWETDSIAAMEALSIPVVTIDYGDQPKGEECIRITGEMLGKEDIAEEMIRVHHEVIAEIFSKTAQIADRPRATYMWSVEPLSCAHAKNYNQFYIDLTGAINVAEKIPARGVNMEQIYVWDPEFIYISNFCPTWPMELLNNTIEGQDWSYVSAVKNGNVYKVPLGGYRWDPPNHESPLMWKWMANIHHPDVFQYDIRNEIKQYYLSFYDYEVSEEQISEILHCEENPELPCCTSP